MFQNEPFDDRPADCRQKIIDTAVAGTPIPKSCEICNIGMCPYSSIEVPATTMPLPEPLPESQWDTFEKYGSNDLLRKALKILDACNNDTIADIQNPNRKKVLQKTCIDISNYLKSSS